MFFMIIGSCCSFIQSILTCIRDNQKTSNQHSRSNQYLVKVAYHADVMEYDEPVTDHSAILAQVTFTRQCPPQPTASLIDSIEVEAENSHNSIRPSGVFNDEKAGPANLLRQPADNNMKELAVQNKTEPGEADADAARQQMLEISPEAPPEYVKHSYAGRSEIKERFAEIANDDSLRVIEPAEMDRAEQLDELKVLLPDADCLFLRAKIYELAGDQEDLRHFVNDSVNWQNYLSCQQKQYTTEFDVERFLELFPDPVAVFEDPKRNTTIVDTSDKIYVQWFMTNKYYQLHTDIVNNIIETHGRINVASIVNALDTYLPEDWHPSRSQNIPLQQELSYFEHKNQILAYLEAQKSRTPQARENVRKLGLMQSCSCCLDQVMPCDILRCSVGRCRFCQDCVKRSTEVAFSEGMVNFPCLSDECDAEFSLPVLESVLPFEMSEELIREWNATEFDVGRFLKLFPDPVAVFEDPKRKTTIVDHSDKIYVRWFMRNKYNQVDKNIINDIIETHGHINMASIVNALDTYLADDWHYNRSQNIPLLQELAYFEHKNQILAHLKAKTIRAAQWRGIFKKLGLMQSCSCCFYEEVIPCDICTCTGGHCRFCRDCVKRNTEVAISEGKVNFPCLSDECDAEFSLAILKRVLPSKLFSKLAQKKTVAVLKAAGIEDLEDCPFCDFVNIFAPEDKLFYCFNPDCMRESCRLCKEPSHMPLRCEDVEKDREVKARTYIENKMSEALMRECWKCGVKFIKEEGCNWIKCVCGAMMCYICRKPIQDYGHFNSQVDHSSQFCPRFSDSIVVHENNVLEAAEKAKNEVDPSQLKNDPTADLYKHFDRVKEVRKQEQRPS